MASIVSAGTTSATALNMSADTTGILQLASNNGTVGLTMDTSQNVGIGTSSPQSALQISGAMPTSPTGNGVHVGITTSNTCMQFNAGSGNVSLIDFSTSGTDFLGRILYDNSGNSMQFSTNSTEAMRIDSNGTAGFNVVPATWWNTASAKQIQFGANSAIWSYSAATNSQTRLYSNAYINASASDTYLNTNAASYYNQYNGEHIWLNAPSGTAGTTVTFTERMRLNSTGALVLAGGSTSANGIGITFPATQSASTDANTLDDYEEGTWTPAFLGTTTNPTITYTAQYGYYVKIGKVVNCWFNIEMSAITGGSGNVRLSGFPFNAGSLGTWQTGSIGYFDSTTAPSAIMKEHNTTYAQFWKRTSTSALSTINQAMDMADLTAGGKYGFVSYTTA